MSLSAILPILSVVALVVTLLQALAKPETDKAVWRKVVILAIILCFINAAVEVGKRAVDKAHEQTEKQKEAEQRATSQQLIADVQSLNRSATAAFERLTRSVNSLPQSTVAALTEDARRVQTQIDAVTQASIGGLHSEADIAQLKGLIEKTQTSLEHFDASIRSQLANQQTLTPVVFQDRSSEIRAASGEAQPLPHSTPGPGPSLPSAPRSAPFIMPVALGISTPTIPAPVEPILIEEAGFAPTGKMGDATVTSAFTIDSHSTDRPYSPPDCQKLVYIPKHGSQGWAALAWQFPEGNWGDMPGKDWSKRGFTHVSVWARAGLDRKGGLPRVQFKAGGGTDPAKKFQASFAVEGDFVTLTQDWKQYSLDLKGKNLSQVIAGFIVVLRAEDSGSEEVTVFLDNISYR